MGLFRKKKPKKYVRMDYLDADSIGKTIQRFRDTRWQYHFEDQDYTLLSDQYKNNAISRKIVSKPAEDATRNGWRLVIPGDEKKQAQYQAELDRLNLKRVLADELIYQRMHGDGYASIGVKELSPTGTDTPLDVNNIANVTFVHAFGMEHVKKLRVNNNPMNDNFGKESAVVVDETEPGEEIDKNGNEITRSYNYKYKPIVIDKSRYFHISLDKIEDSTTGTSILTRCQDQIKVMDTALYSTGKMLFEYTLKVVNSDQLANESKDQFQKDKQVMNEGMTTESVLVLSNSESIMKLGTNVSGIDSLIGFAWQSLASASEIPKSVLTGEQAGTLAGASQDVVNYYDNVKSMQEELLKPQIERIVELLMWSSEVAGGSEDPDSIDGWKIEFNPLWSADEHTQAQTFSTYVSAMATLVSSGIKSTQEAEQLLQGLGATNITALQPRTDSADVKIDKSVLDEYLKSKKEAEAHGEKT